MASTQVEVIVRLGPDIIQRRLINPGEYFIGSDPACHLHVKDDSASHKHARLLFDGEKFVVEDLGSTNGSFLDGVRMTGLVPIRLGQQLQIGQSLLELAPLGEPAQAAHAVESSITADDWLAMSCTAGASGGAVFALKPNSPFQEEVGGFAASG